MNRRQAPSVSYPVGPCVLYGRLLQASWGLGVVIVSAQASYAGVVPIGGLVLLAFTGALAWWAWRRAPRGELRWAADRGWGWTVGDNVSDLPVPVLVWRGRHHLLLQVSAGSRPLRWLWVERWRDPSRWQAICRAVQAG